MDMNLHLVDINGALIDAIVRVARSAGREIASPAEARTLLALG